MKQPFYYLSTAYSSYLQSPGNKLQSSAILAEIPWDTSVKAIAKFLALDEIDKKAANQELATKEMSTFAKEYFNADEHMVVVFNDIGLALSAPEQVAKRPPNFVSKDGVRLWALIFNPQRITEAAEET